jgi:hypothetical protein
MPAKCSARSIQDSRVGSAGQWVTIESLSDLAHLSHAVRTAGRAQLAHDFGHGWMGWMVARICNATIAYEYHMHLHFHYYFRPLALSVGLRSRTRILRASLIRQASRCFYSETIEVLYQLYPALACRPRPLISSPTDRQHNRITRGAQACLSGILFVFRFLSCVPPSTISKAGSE